MKRQGETTRSKDTRKNLLFGVISLIAFALFIYRSDVAIEYMKKGLVLCSATVVPSLFPFMIISELIIKSPVTHKLCRILKKPMNLLFGVSEAGGCAYILGALCGFPIGAKCAISAYDNGDISKDELSRILCFCNNPGSAFVISAIGISLFGNQRLGVVMYACVILSSIVVGVFVNVFSGKKHFENNEYSYKDDGSCSAITVFTTAVSRSAVSMLTVCAYVVFFSAMVGCIGDILKSISVPDVLTTMIFGFFEMTSGVNAAASMHSIKPAVILCAAFAAWSGISVHCQIITICSGKGLSYKKYFLSKAAQGIICALFMGISINFLFPEMLQTFNGNFLPSGSALDIMKPTFECFLFFSASISGVLIGRKVNSQKGFHVVDKKI